MARGVDARTRDSPRSRTVSAATLATATTSAATSAITAAEIVSRAARWSAIAARTRFVDLQIAAAGFLAVESSDGLGSFVVIGHFNEGKTSSTTGFAVHGHVHAGDLTERLEQGSQIALGRSENSCFRQKGSSCFFLILCEAQTAGPGGRVLERCDR